MATTVMYPGCLQGMGSAMRKKDDEDLVYKGPWVRTAQQRLFQTLEDDYGFPRATCRSLVNLMWDFLNETYGEKLHEGQLTIHIADANEAPGKSVKDLRTVPVNLTLHDRNDIRILAAEGISGLRKKKVIRLSNEARDQGGLLTQEDLAVLLCSSRRTIRRDIKELKEIDIDVPTRGNIHDIGPGVSHKTKIVKMWLDGYEYTDLERRTGHSGTSVQRYLSGFSKVVKFHHRNYSVQEIRELTEMSERLVKEYLGLYEEYREKPEAQNRLEQILSDPEEKKNTVQRKKRGGGVVI